ncbi:hypothetical protein [Phenylobacterium sp.]|uniref:hypothetical protein n=1 Tax=Phenylobacterium sp. TaxID=1871053 RepID=UPI0011FE8240|nr:hypothetical protein [Phenylobacterium sp.]THD61027.1 MAG: hypothetical protein E8A49_12220 [Phenylobacterium sp.]
MSIVRDGLALRPLAEPLRLAAIELADLARLGDQLQRAIGRLTETRGVPDVEFLVEAQAADLLSQRLEGMAAFLRALADAAPEEVMTDVYAAVMELTLAEQARRLTGPHTPAPADSDAGGELQLFEA